MKGLEIAKRFFIEWGQPFLLKEFGEVSPRVAAGRFSGSDVIGADDETSHDHDWGPQFSLFLSAVDYHQYGEAISERMNAAAPTSWQSYRVAGAGDKNVQVFSIPQWIKDNLGLLQIPPAPSDWVSLAQTYESQLFFLRHGALWADGSGEMTACRKALYQYPEEQHIQRIAEECFHAWHYGEYNFVQRIAKRRDPLAITVCLGEFTKAVMKIQLLLAGDYIPYWKWLPYIFREQPGAVTYLQPLERLALSNDLPERVELVQFICKSLHEQLLSLGIVSGKEGNIYLLPLLNDYMELRNRPKKMESQ